MSMTKQQKIYACFGGAVGVCALALGWFLYSAYADYQAALEGDEEGAEGLSSAKEKNNRFYTQSKPFPSRGVDKPGYRDGRAWRLPASTVRP